MKPYPPAIAIVAALLAPLAVACGDEAARDGALEVTIYGQPFVEDRIPPESVADGWTIDFLRFLVVVDDVTVAAGDAAPALSSGEPRVFDLTKPSGGNGHLVVRADVPGGRYDTTGFTLGPLDADVVGGNASAGDVALMRDNGYALFVQGLANKDGVQKAFAWGFSATVAHQACPSDARIDGDKAGVQITLQADRIFRDALADDVDPVPAIRFDAFALADEDGDENGDVTLAELAAVDLDTLPDYRVGERTDIGDLKAFIEAQATALGFVDGDGACTVTRQ